MFVQEVTLNDGSTVQVHTRPSFEQIKAVVKARRKHSATEEEEEIIREMTLILCAGWTVKDENGNLLPFTKDGVGQAPWDVLSELADRLVAYLGQGAVAERLALIASSLSEEDPARVKIEALALELAGN